MVLRLVLRPYGVVCGSPDKANWWKSGAKMEIIPYIATNINTYTKEVGILRKKLKEIPEIVPYNSFGVVARLVTSRLREEKSKKVMYVIITESIDPTKYGLPEILAAYTVSVKPVLESLNSRKREIKKKEWREGSRIYKNVQTICRKRTYGVQLTIAAQWP